MALPWNYKLQVKLTEVKVPGSGKNRVFSFFFKEQFREVHDSSGHDACENNSKKHKERFPFDSFPGNKIPRKWWLQEEFSFSLKGSSHVQCWLSKGTNQITKQQVSCGFSAKILLEVDNNTKSILFRVGKSEKNRANLRGGKLRQCCQ